MDNPENITAYFLDVAKRHPDIQHVPGADDTKHFYEMEWEEMVQNAQQLSMRGFNLILEDYEEAFHDNGGDYVSETPVIAFMILTNVEIGNAPAKLAAFEEARRIAKSIVGKMKADELAGCDADVPDGVTAPRYADLSTLRIMRVIPPFFQNACGVRVSIKWRTDHDAQFDRTLVTWPPLP